MFLLKILSKDRMIFEDEVNRVRVEGVDSDYELLSFHADLAGILMRGKVVIDDRYKILIKGGLVSFHNNRCVVLIEEYKRRAKQAPE